jgi:hypothetical protein
MRLRMNYQATCQWRTPEVDFTEDDFKVFRELGYEGEDVDDFVEFITERGLDEISCELGDGHEELIDKLYTLNGDYDWEMWDDSSWKGRDDVIQVHPEDDDGSDTPTYVV